MASKVLDKSYDPHPVEERWYQSWTDRNYFRADENSGREPYSIVIPPPNVTGVLHIGHALNNTLQDILIRFKSPLDAGDGPCRHRHTECGGKTAHGRGP
jgi:valyl-tRNA synthetase